MVMNVRACDRLPEGSPSQPYLGCSEKSLSVTFF